MDNDGFADVDKKKENNANIHQALKPGAHKQTIIEDKWHRTNNNWPPQRSILEPDQTKPGNGIGKIWWNIMFVFLLSWAFQNSPEQKKAKQNTSLDNTIWIKAFFILFLDYAVNQSANEEKCCNLLWLYANWAWFVILDKQEFTQTQEKKG